jgi:hypothetical protein
LLLPALRTAAADSYVIELLVFQRTGLGEARHEIWPDQSVAGEAGAIVLADPHRSAGAGFRLLGSDATRLGGARAKLERADRYVPILHLTWVQPGLGEGAARPVWIEGGRRLEVESYRGDDSLSQLEGTVKLVRNRFLHLRADLLYRREVPAEVLETGARDPGESAPSRVLQFRLRETRRMETGVIHYLDHPLFGVIVQVRRA